MAPRPYRARDSVTRTRTRSPGTAPRTNITYPSSLPTPSPPNARSSIWSSIVSPRRGFAMPTPWYWRPPEASISPTATPPDLLAVAASRDGAYDDRAMRVQAPRAVGDLLPAAMPQLGERLLEYKIQTAWTSIVGPDVARRARASAMSGGTLEILVDNSPWLHELTLRSDDLLRRVRERFPEISAVKFALSTAPVAPSSRERTGVPRPERTALTPSDLAEIDLAVSVIPDPTIADAARRLLTTARRSPLSRSLRIALLTVALPLFAACATARPAVTPVATDAPERSVPAAPDVRAEAYYHYAVAQTYALAGRFKEATAEIQE